MSAIHEPPFERADGEAERLAAGFAEHVVHWARRLQADDATLEVLRRCAHATSLATSNGHVCILLSELADSSRSLSGEGQPLSPSTSGAGQDLSPSPSGGGQGWEHLPDAATLRSTLLSTGVVGTPDHPAALPLILDEDGRLYLHRYFDYEVRLACRLMQAAEAPPRAVTPAARALLDSLFPSAPDNEVDWQKIAAAMALRGSLTVISGGPGTGKTTTVVNLLACLLTQEPHARIALAAPTGKAAARMIEAIRQRAGHLPPDLHPRLPQESFTIHRLLGANPGQGRFTHDAANRLAIDALIVDEASMLDLALATRLLEAVPASARIILLGDKDQLAAVEAGAVFAELSADPTLTDECRRALADLCGYAPERIAPPAPAHVSPLHDAAVWLTKNYRFPADSAIAKLARYINEGRAEEAMALLREARAATANAASASQPLAPSSSSTKGTQQAKTKNARKRTGDSASLSLFPELEPAAAGVGPIAPNRDRDTSIQWLDPDRGDNALDAILAGYASYFEAVRRGPTDVDAIFRAFNQFRVLCAVRDGPQGANAINEQVARSARVAMVLGAAADRPEPGSPWYAGRPVVVARNDYALKLSNGDVGIALPDAAGGLSVFIPDAANGYRSVPTMRMPPHDTAFAMTIHKAQGSEFERIVVLMPARPSRVLSRELLYTAITRAKAAVTVHARAEILGIAIGATLRRESGLRRRA